MKVQSKLSYILPIFITLYFIYELLILRKPYIFIDNVNLLFHEAGHILFIPFGEYITALGGTIMQCLIPLLVVFSFWRQSNYRGLSFGISWFGQNLINVSYYMADAETMLLPLIGGSHDWNYLLGTIGLLSYATVFGNFLFWFGGLILVLTFIFLVHQVAKPYQFLKTA